jgi:azurin
MKTTTTLLCAALLAGACTACNEKKEAPPAPSPAPTSAPAPKAEAPAPTASAPPAQKVEIQIASVGNLMAFDKKTLTVPAGALVHVTFKNSGTQDVMQHNWVLVMPGKEASVAAAGLARAVTTGYVVPGPDVLAYTPMTKPGETAETTFTAPAPGTYPYICTFPGHYIMMKGVLTVTP